MQRHIPVEVLDKCTDITWWFPEQDSAAQPSYANATFEVPANEPLFLVSQGNLSYGTIEFLPNPDVAAENTKVDVSVYYKTRSLLDSARVCSLAQAEAKHGLMFYVSPDPVIGLKELLLIWGS